MLLPTLHNKLFVYEKYQTACEDANHQPVSLWVFRKLWNSFFATKPRTDLCMTCQQNISLVMRTQNCEDIDKKKNSILRHLEHLDLAQKQRMDYQQRSYYQKKLLERLLI